MTKSDTATLVIGTGKFYTAPTGTAAPTTLAGLLTPANTWVDLGHTSEDDIISFASDGGDVTTLSTLQSPILRSTTSVRVESFTINMHQWDATALKLYYGSNFAEISTGSIFSGVPTSPTISTLAFLAVFQDGATNFALYAPRAEIYRGDDLDFSDNETLTRLPLNVKPLTYSTNTWAYSVTPLT